MSSSDPTHLWRSPQFRARVPLPLYRSLLTATAVACVTYAELLDPLSQSATSGGGTLGVLAPQSSPSFKRPKRPLVGGHRGREKAAAAHVAAMANLNVLAHLKVCGRPLRRFSLFCIKRFTVGFNPLVLADALSSRPLLQRTKSPTTIHSPTPSPPSM
jgi:hypothetical protein